MITTIKIDICKDHLIFRDGSMAYMIDTGSPLSFTEVPAMFLGRHKIMPNPMVEDIYRQASDYIGAPVNGFIGTDILLGYALRIDVHNGFMTFSDEGLEGEEQQEKFFVSADELMGGAAEGRTRTLDAYLGIPCLAKRIRAGGGYLFFDMKVRGRSARMAFDTGAKTSYIREAYVRGVQAAEKDRPDFNPSLGHFSSDIYRLQCCLGGKKAVPCPEAEPFDAGFGSFPAVSQMLAFLSADGIIGFELLKRFEVVVDVARNYLWLRKRG